MHCNTLQTEYCSLQHTTTLQHTAHCPLQHTAQTLQHTAYGSTLLIAHYKMPPYTLATTHYTLQNIRCILYWTTEHCRVNLYIEIPQLVPGNTLVIHCASQSGYTVVQFTLCKLQSSLSSISQVTSTSNSSLYFPVLGTDLAVQGELYAQANWNSYFLRVGVGWVAQRLIFALSYCQGWQSSKTI